MRQPVTLVRSKPPDALTGWPGIPVLLERIYRSRGVRDPGELDLSLEGLCEPSGMPGLDVAVDLLLENTDQSILVVGDYDTDGATATALAILGLRALGWTRVDYLIPNRFTHGYGLSRALIEEILPRKPDLILTVDQGTTSHEGIQYARHAGIKVLVTDHHLPGAICPPANALVNPNLPGSVFRAQTLAGVGVLFYLLIALRARMRAQNCLPTEAPSLASWLDLVALGTIADLVPLDRNNRILVAQGLRRIRQGACRPGLQALIEVSHKSAMAITEEDLAFSVAPRLNAAGRLEDMRLGVACLLADDPETARQSAQALDQINQRRRSVQEDVEVDALEQVVQNMLPGTSELACVLFDRDWHLGILGLIASRIKERVHRPVFVLACSPAGELKGSARSILGVHIRDVLVTLDARYPRVLKQFGGHAMAAGLTLCEGVSIEEFRVCLEEVIEPYRAVCDMGQHIHTDGVLPVHEITLDTATAIAQGGPWGSGFPKPLFEGSFRIERIASRSERHCRVVLRDQEGEKCFQAYGFSASARACEAGKSGYFLFLPVVNRYGGREMLELQVMDQFGADEITCIERAKF
ncbi:ssDNA exonuclease RecJ [mine drainage metagenome]|uniref:Single-stranded-DNA-specific exonuclease RecJ n=3 Tax=mine drainage metagenome TaxID=410659 RepID=T1A749_9ZZZZ